MLQRLIVPGQGNMRTRLSLYLLAWSLAVALANCSADSLQVVIIPADQRPFGTSSLTRGDVIYQVSEETGLATVLEACEALYPKLPVHDVVWGYRRGYQVEEHSALGNDFWRHRLLVIPVVGTGPNRNEVRGYWYNYEGSGTLPTRDERITGLARFIRTRLESRAVTVIMRHDDDYETDGRAYLSRERNAGDALLAVRRAPTSNADRLNYLDEMRQRGRISEEEYEAKRRQILDRM